MIREPVVLLALGALALGCSTSSDRPGTNSSLCVPVDGGPPCRGGPVGPTPPTPPTPPTFDSGATTPDATAPEDASTSVTGTLRLYRDLPPGATTAAMTSGWNLRALPAVGVDAGVDGGADDAGVTLVETATTGTGDFTLPGVPPVGVSPATGLPSFWLELTFPVMGNIGTMFELPAETRSVELRAFTDDTLRVALNAQTLTQADDRAVIAVWVRESRAEGAAAVSNVTVTADGQASPTLYDGPSGIMEMSVSGTGPRGFAILPNVAVPASGDGFATVTGSRAPRSYQVRVRRRMVSWLVLTAS